MVDAIVEHFENEPDRYIWFDLYSNNQIKAPNYGFEYWSSTFESAIRDFNHVVVVCSPWKEPIPFTRAWCIFEIYCAAKTNSQFELAFSKQERHRFLEGQP